MTTILYQHPSFLDHDTGDWHPESADRLRAVNAALDLPAFPQVLRKLAPSASLDHLWRAHDRKYVTSIMEAQIADGEHRHFDPDSLMSKGSATAAVHAAGAVIAAIDDVLDGQADNAFCAVRPPGHHAERQQGMGFCLFNNIAVGALYARHVRHIDRVAVVDFDVHHGNGTQHILADDPGIFYASIHEDGTFPGTGQLNDTAGQAAIVNIPLPSGVGSALFRQAYERIILPRLNKFAPQLLLISAGFDGHIDDPMANFHLQTDDFAWITQQLGDLARTHCQNRMVSVLEGGYDIPALTASVCEHLRILTEC